MYDPVDVSSIPEPIPKLEPRSKYGNPPIYAVLGRKYRVLPHSRGFKEKGQASWYGTQFHGRRTSSGEQYDMYKLTAAHKTLPLPCYVRVKNLDNGKSLIVRVNDRGPFHHGRIIDLSYAAAKKLGVYGRGVANVEIENILPGSAPTKVPTAPFQAPQNSPKAFYIQIASLRDKNAAHALAAELRKKISHPITVANTQPLNVYKVQLGPLSTRAEAKALSDKLKSTEALSGNLFIVERGMQG